MYKTDEERKQARREAQARYRSGKGRVKNIEWRRSEAGKLSRRLWKQRRKERGYALPTLKPVFSQVCSIKGCELPAERHHPNYATPDYYVWLCATHHRAVHGKEKRKCSVCDRPHSAKGLCKKHYEQQRLNKQRG